jgi:hypothetical protein
VRIDYVLLLSLLPVIVCEWYRVCLLGTFLLLRLCGCAAVLHVFVCFPPPTTPSHFGSLHVSAMPSSFLSLSLCSGRRTPGPCRYRLANSLAVKLNSKVVLKPFVGTINFSPDDFFFPPPPNPACGVSFAMRAKSARANG